MLGFLKSFSSNIHYKYAVSTRPAFEAGCWTVFDAKHKTSGDPVSVFVFNKKQVAELLASSGIKPRSAVLNEVWEFAARGVQQLTKIRHPAVLRLVEPMEASKNTMTFVTERVVGSVDLLHESDLDELSVVRGLTSIVQALQFLHTQLGVVHANVSPRTVFADLQGDWKLASLEFAAPFEEAAPGSFHLPLLDPRMPAYMHPSYDYLAPELVLQRTLVPANDVWSVACLLFFVYLRRSPLQTRNNPSSYKEELARLQHKLEQPQTRSKFPQSLQPYLPSLFCETADGRLAIPTLETTDYFQNPLIKALKALDEYSAKPVEDKVGFLKHFQTLLPQFPKQMRIRKIAKFAAKELRGPRDAATATLLGNVLFAVCADMSKLSFQEQVLPLFAPLADYFPFQESVAGNMAIISRATSDKDFSKSVLPVLVDALKFHDAQHAAVQSRLLASADVYAANVTVSKLEQTLFPAVIDCFAATPAKPVKTAATEALGVLVHRGVSKALITDRLVPALQAMKTRDPAVVVAVAKLWKEVCAKLGPQQVFTLALPHLLELSLAGKLTVDQFKQFMAIVREQLSAVEKEQLKALAHNQPASDDDWLNDPAAAPPAAAAAPPAAAPAAAAPAAHVAPIAAPPGPLHLVPQQRSTGPVASSSPVLSPLDGPIANTPAARVSSFTVNSAHAKPLNAQRSQKLPELPPPKLTPASTRTTPAAAAASPATLRMAPPSHKTLDAMRPTQRSVSSPSSTMPALIPSGSSTTSSTASSGDLLGFAPLQPQKPPHQPQQSSEFGSFVQSSSAAQSNNTFESLI